MYLFLGMSSWEVCSSNLGKCTDHAGIMVSVVKETKMKRHDPILGKNVVWQSTEVEIKALGLGRM